MFGGLTLRAHLDRNYGSGFYVNASDPAYVGPGSASNVYQPIGEKAFL
ncbi:hypothetical protein EP837_02676 [Sphingobium sp. EP60837]|uniref:Uncharacterized protein n=1 Tax=Sphingobium tyrosinilyticum TaxID=2715436 RepID=A0ABV9EVK9_9SPHN|nr:hypothetical protein EP837_02676 [Sphingobium sp. EP60837]